MLSDSNRLTQKRNVGCVYREEGTTKYPYEHKHTHAMQREHLTCLLSVRLIILVVLLHETIALNAIYKHCVFRNGITNIVKFVEKTKKYLWGLSCSRLEGYGELGWIGILMRLRMRDFFKELPLNFLNSLYSP